MGSRNKSLLMLSIALVYVLIMPIMIAGQPAYKQGTPITLSVPCTFNGIICPSGTTCVATIIDPEQIIIINNQTMTRNNAVYEINLTANQTETNGEYQLAIACSYGGNSRTRFLNYYITPNGEIPTTSKGILYVGILAVLVVLFILAIWGGIQANYIPLKSFVWLFAYLLLIAISFIAWNLSLDYLTSSPFLISMFRIIWIFFMIGLFPVLLVLIFYSGWMLTKIKAIENMIERGIPVDEAYERTVKGGFKF